MPRVVGMHFVCHGDLNVTDYGDGTFDTGFWKVARHHCPSVEYVALHESRSTPSYRHGRVIRWRVVEKKGFPRVVFTVLQDESPRQWVGSGTGEKGFLWSDHDG
jgi:hypothetical protein